MTSSDPVNALPLNELIVFIKERDHMSLAKLRDRALQRGVNACSNATLTRLVYTPMNVYPTPDVIETVAAALSLSYDQVLNACTRQMGYPKVWRAPGGTATVIADIDMTPDQVEQAAERGRQAVRRESHRE